MKWNDIFCLNDQTLDLEKFIINGFYKINIKYAEKVYKHIKFDDFLIVRVEHQLRSELRKLAEKLMTRESALLRQEFLYILHKMA